MLKSFKIRNGFLNTNVSDSISASKVKGLQDGLTANSFQMMVGKGGRVVQDKGLQFWQSFAFVGGCFQPGHWDLTLGQLQCFQGRWQTIVTQRTETCLLQVEVFQAGITLIQDLEDGWS